MEHATTDPPPVIHRDERIVVVDKPTGLLSVPGIGPEKADCVVARLAVADPAVRIVHRLDRDTSGVMILARDAEAHRGLSIQFQDRLVEKRYIAVAAGRLAEDEGVIDLPIRKDLDDPPRQRIDLVHGRPSTTRWRVLERARDRTRLELTPETGRSHQLRLHLRTIGHPILGDDLYAPPHLRALADRLLLHALMLRIAHPSTARPMTFEAPCPF
jgi:tRNA pseudouridine32 synthase/23S rRNA pseudouridine746 synthase